MTKTNTTTNTGRRFVVILGERRTSIGPLPIWLGELTRGVRQGVTKQENALRFTRTGAERVAAQYANACVAEVRA